jgi:hypothetical protein
MSSNTLDPETGETMPDPAAERKPPRRFWLYAPYALVGIAALGWSLGWWVLTGKVKTDMDKQAEALRQAGYQVSWTSRKIGGYPFRIDVTLTEAKLSEPSGWGLSFPVLKTEAFAYSLNHLVLVAPDGVTVMRPVSGPMRVTAKALRASLVQSGVALPRLAVEGVGLGFSPEPGAGRFGLASADKLEFHLIPGGKDEMAMLLRLDGGKASGGGLTARLAGSKPVSLLWDATLSQREAFKGRDWPDAVRSWTAAGGALSLKQGGLSLGDTQMGLIGGRLTVGADGRLRGSLEANLKLGVQALLAMGDNGLIDPSAAQIAAAVIQAREAGLEAKGARVNLNFEAGRTTIGPVALGQAPKVY